MKRVLAIFIFSFLLSCYSQEDPFLSGEGFLPLWNNPASYGTWNKFSVNTDARILWKYLSNGPETFLLNSEYKINLSDKHKLGIGLFYLNHKFSYQRDNWFGIPLNYQFKAKKLNYSIGLSPRLLNTSFSPIPVPPQTINDSALPMLGAGTVFSMDIGTMVYNNDFYAGISITHLVSTYFETSIFNLAPQYYLQAGYKFLFKGNKHSIFPQFSYLYDGVVHGLNTMVYYQLKDEIFSVGAGYRSTSTIPLAIASTIKKFRLAYHLDIYTGPLASYATFSHEIRLSFRIREDY